MATLLLRFAAPLQAWGTDSKFETRDTGREPSKSGVVGLLASALGYRRSESEKLTELNKLKFGIRVDREGKQLRDFHMARDNKASYLTHRYYLSDAVFLIGLEGDEKLLHDLEYALSHPAFPLFLGRRSCPPTPPICLGIRELPLIEALRNEPLLVNNPSKRIRIVADADQNDRKTSIQRDIAISFDQGRRRYTYRNVAEKAPLCATVTEHNPYDKLEDED